jgi:ABC-type polysaccharide/polyol phosphate transport system ATPase subunit
MARGDVVVQVDDLSKRFRLFHDRNQSLKQTLLNRRRARYEDFWALRDVTFDVREGETFGIVGHNGSGKSTLLKLLTGILRPDGGRLKVNGSISALLELGAGFHMELTGRENVFLNAAILGVPRSHILDRFDDIVSFSGMEQFIDTPVKNYSSGMFVRLGFAVAINVDPDVLIIDEVLAVGDAEFQAKCGDKIAEFRERGKTIVLVTHGMGDVVRLCQRAAWLDHGRLVRVGEPDSIVDDYVHAAHGAREVVDERGVRWGSGEAMVEHVGLVGGDGQELAKPQTGDALGIRVSLSSRQRVDDPEIVVTVVDQAGLKVSEISTRRRGFAVPPIDGECEVVLEIDSLPLLEGTYEISTTVRDHSGQRDLDVWDKCVRFDVHRGKPYDDGLITLGDRWSTA